jgi:tripartite-type tricarboxylate transporter receptor subunit TctC
MVSTSPPSHNHFHRSGIFWLCELANANATTTETMDRRTANLILAAAISSALLPAHGEENFPSRPIRLIAGTLPGGPTDTLARHIAARIAGPLGQAVFVENKAGASGTMAGMEVATSKPDGYTLQMGTTSANVLPPLLKLKPPFDPVKDFTPVAILGVVPLVAYVTPSLPVRTLKEFAELAKRSPGKFSYGSAGLGTTSNLSGEMFKLINGNLDITHVPYRGAPAMDQAVMSGEIQMGFNTVGGMAELHKGGKVRALAVLSDHRSDLLPGVPTAAEAGMKDLRGVVSFYLLAPPNVSRMALAKLHAVVNDALADPKFQVELRSMGIDPAAPASTDEASRYVRDEVTRWQDVIKAARIPRSE